MSVCVAHSCISRAKPSGTFRRGALPLTRTCQLRSDFSFDACLPIQLTRTHSWFSSTVISLMLSCRFHHLQGYQQLIIGRWQPDLTRSVLAHWLDSMNGQGWIPNQKYINFGMRVSTGIISRPDMGIERTDSFDNRQSLS